MTTSSAVCCISNQGTRFELDRYIVKPSELLKGSNSEEGIVLESLNDHDLQLVVDYLSHYSIEPSIIPCTLSNSNLNEVLTNWDCEFLNSKINFANDSEIVKFADSTECLKIEPLKMILACKMACMLMDEPIERLQQLFPDFF